MRVLIALCSILALPAAAHAATTHCVNPSGTGGCFSAVQDAVAAAGKNDRIEIAAGTYDIGHITLDGQTRLELVGAGSASTILDGGFSYFQKGGPQLTLRNVTIQNGNENGTAFEVLVKGRLVLIDSVVEGAPIGVKCSNAKVEIEQTTIRGNLGGLTLFQRCRAVISNSTITGNSVEGLSAGGKANVRLSNVTISGNGDGFLVGGAKVAMSNVTITSNTALGLRPTDRTKVSNSIIAGNAGGDCDGEMRSAGFNLIGDSSNCEIRGHDLDLLNVDPMLEPLAPNGGPTETHALAAGSPAIDAGNPLPLGEGIRCRPEDQRGVARVGRCDIGSYEFP